MIYSFDKVLIIGNGYEASGGGSGSSATWATLGGKPLAFPPDTHDNSKHSVEYATVSDINNSKNVFIQNNNPNMTNPGMWIQTGLGTGSDFTIWIEDGE